MRNIQTAVSPHPLKIFHIFMKLFTRNNPYYHLLKYLLFLLKHPVYVQIYKGCKTRCLMHVVYIFPENPN
jgi:hypothetical protein